MLIDEKKLIDSLKAGTLDIDCTEITLTQDSHENPRIFRGPGYIRQGDNEEIIFKIYTDHPVQELEPLGTPGVLIPPDRFYNFNATDIQGYVWVGNRVLPLVSIRYLSNGTTTIVEGKIHTITKEGKSLSRTATNVIVLRIFTDQEIPCHSATVVETNVPDYHHHRLSTLNLVTITSCGSDFLLTMQPGELTVEVWSDQPFSPHFDNRILEALQFVLARRLQWRVLEKESEGKRITQLSSPIPLAKSRLQAPINLNEIRARHWTWILFDNYLVFIANYTEQVWHPCSVQLMMVYEASAGSIDAEILALSVAAEGLAKILFSTIVSVTEKFQTTVNELKVVVDKWIEENTAAEKSGLSKRLSGLFSMLKEIRAVDRLLQLEQLGIIESKHINAWKKLRNAAAHAATPGTQEWQQLLDRRDLVLALLYRLIFHAIGYEGYCSDYGTRLWPVIELPQHKIDTVLGEDGQITCTTRAFRHVLTYCGNPEQGNWKWQIRSQQSEEIEESGTGLNQADAFRLARICAENRHKNRVVREKI
ncbi:hypothetical protein [Fimbriiglobus ruber]|uniref:ApeA N-terminal domain-containing protein n=1 Tax=Fimbriiglobus ruber TaxID=1908690 RepID=A0A225D9E6_9BACT|nr:hypothetical protein [Fimbriiglobus ruber]OWK36284.1 hypothetical protein FRUB_08847 [Fimbriiglobus ruber]